MRAFTKMALAIGLAASLSSVAQAQGPGGRMGGMMGGGINLLSNKSVQKELKMTDEQIEKADKAVTEMREKMMAKMGDLRDLEPAERQEKMQSVMKEMGTESKKITDELLKPEQAKRLDQISLQSRGASALADPELQTKLKMTDEQKEKVQNLNEDTMAQMRDLRQEMQDDPEGTRKKIQDLQKETNAKAMALMTDDQKAMWKDMTGEPFTIVMEPRRRPGGNQ